MMQATTQAISETHRVLVAEKYFEATNASIREPSSNPTSTEETSLRRGYNAGIKRSIAVLKQIDLCLEALEAYENWENNKKGDKSGSSNNKQQQDDTIVEGSSNNNKRRNKVVARPPHMDRAPVIDEVVN
jgi:hypothetical protein